MKGRPLPRFCSHKCRGHTGFRPGGPLFISEMTDEQKLERLKKSFEKHVIRQEGCWGWKGPVSKGGYPVMSCRRGIGPDKGHRASWLIYKGNLQKEKHVCHSCDNPICTNPDHLWMGTPKENNDDKIKKGRGNCPPPPIKKGSENGSSVLDEEKVKEIKIKLRDGKSAYSICKIYGVSKQTILRIKNGVNWSHVNI
jgi:hypothetical protein